MNQVYDCLRKRYPESEYVLMQEVSDAAGFSRSRSIDFLVKGLWPSRGMLLEGIELKSSRTDWLRELKNPAKQESVFVFCDKFWLLTADKDIAKESEIPDTWGHMTITDNEKIKVLKEAPKLTPLPPTSSFIATMLKRSSDKTGYIRKDSIQEQLEKARNEAISAEQMKVRHQLDYAKELQYRVSEFERETGINLGFRFSDHKKIAPKLKFVLDGGVDGMMDKILGMQKDCQNILKTLSDIIPEDKTLNQESFQK